MFAKGSWFPERSARRRATVTISVPLASSALAMVSLEANFPVPKRSREEKVRPAMTSGSCDGAIGSEATGARLVWESWKGGLVELPRAIF
jgi:hypothetical protein